MRERKFTHDHVRVLEPDPRCMHAGIVPETLHWTPMGIVGHIESIWRYPVKSMRGEELPCVDAGFGGIQGDRRFAFQSNIAPRALPYLTGRAQEQMLLYRPFYQSAPSPGEPPRLMVETPSGEVLAISDPRLISLLTHGLRQQHEITLVSEEKALADEYPVSLFSVQTARQLSAELGIAVDKRRFRANFYLDLTEERGFLEDSFVGHRLRIGQSLVVEVVKRDPRCKMIAIEPDTAEPTLEILRHVAAAHERCAGVYASVLLEGHVKQGDPVVLLG